MIAKKINTVFLLLAVILGVSLHTTAKGKGIFNSTKITAVQDDSLVQLYKAISRNPSDKDRRIANEAFNNALTKFKNKDLFNAPFDSLRKTISILDAPDNSFRIITWTVYYNKGVYNFYGFIISRQNDSIVKFPLTDNSAKMLKPDEITTTNAEWYGALYYEIIKSGTSEDPYYVLLGWDGNDLFTNRKVIEALWFDENFVPNFGKPVFHFKEDDLRQRVVFEFSETSTMKLRYEPKYTMIVFDHLSPAKPELEGRPESYGSDFTFDALHFDEDKWNLLEDINIRNPKTKLSKKQKNK
jgi:hypothetical protein